MGADRDPFDLGRLQLFEESKHHWEFCRTFWMALREKFNAFSVGAAKEVTLQTPCPVAKKLEKASIAKWVTACFVLSFSSATYSAEQARMQAAQTAVNNMAEETLECAAYFDIVSLALMNSNGADIAQEYINARKLAVDRAESLNQGILNARYNALIEDMTRKIILANQAKRIDDHLSNIAIEDISVLRDQYAKLCKEVLSDPGARAKYWMEKVSPSP